VVRSCALADEVKSVVAMKAEETAACGVRSDNKRMLTRLEEIENDQELLAGEIGRSLKMAGKRIFFFFLTTGKMYEL